MDSVKLGVVPTHCKFVGGLVPDGNDRLPRNDQGDLVVLSEMKSLVLESKTPISAVQVSYFANAAGSDYDELFGGLKELGLELSLILMVGGVDPTAASDEDAFVQMLVTGLEAAKKYGIETVASTSFEEWMKPDAEPLTGPAYDEAVQQLAKSHVRAIQEAKIENSSVKEWHLEFLRTGEFVTFTNLEKAWEVVKTANQQLGSDIFKVVVDSAHCGDSDLSVGENVTLINEIAAADDLGMFHASAPSTRGCITSDEGWIPTLLAAAQKTGKLTHCYLELFHHEDPALEGLRQLVPNHGKDTTLGRSYTQCVLDGLEDLHRRTQNNASLTS